MACVISAAARGSSTTCSSLHRCLLPQSLQFARARFQKLCTMSEEGLFQHRYVISRPSCALGLHLVQPRFAACHKQPNRLHRCVIPSAFAALLCIAGAAARPDDVHALQGAGQAGPAVGVKLQDDPSENLAVVTSTCQQASVTTSVRCSSMFHGYHGHKRASQGSCSTVCLATTVVTTLPAPYLPHSLHTITLFIAETVSFVNQLFLKGGRSPNELFTNSAAALFRTPPEAVAHTPRDCFATKSHRRRFPGSLYALNQGPHEWPFHAGCHIAATLLPPSQSNIIPKF